MSLYSKKLHIKKPNNQIQIANLYTDKNDVGSNYLTLNDNNNIVYAPLMNNLITERSRFPNTKKPLSRNSRYQGIQ